MDGSWRRLHVIACCQNIYVELERHGLSTAYLQDNEILAQIIKDVMRTHPDMHFFSGDAPEAQAHREVTLAFGSLVLFDMVVYLDVVFMLLLRG